MFVYLSFLFVLQIYLKEHRFSNAKASDLWKAMSKVSLCKYGCPCVKARKVCAKRVDRYKF